MSEEETSSDNCPEGKHLDCEKCCCDTGDDCRSILGGPQQKMPGPCYHSGEPGNYDCISPSE